MYIIQPSAATCVPVVLGCKNTVLKHSKARLREQGKIIKHLLLIMWDYAFHLKRKVSLMHSRHAKREQPCQDYLLYLKLQLYENNVKSPLEGSNNANILISHFSLS